MPGARIDRLLASTAVVLLLTAASGGALADPATIGGAPTAHAIGNPATPTATAEPAAQTSAASATAEPTAPAAETSLPAATEANAPAASAAPVTPSETTGSVGETGSPAATTTPATTAPAAAAPASTTAPATAAAPPAPTLAPADVAIAEQLKQLGAGKFDHIVGGKTERAAIEAFYSGRNFAPLWITDGQLNARAKAAIEYLRHVDADGLDPADYPVPNFATLSDPGALAEAELRFSMSVITYAHHAAIGRVHWSRVSGDILYTDKAPEAAEVLAAVLEAKDVGAALAAYEPHAPGYLALKAKLAQIRGGRGDDSKPPIPNGPVLKVGAQDARVPQLRERLGVTGDGNTYDKALAEAVKKFQKEHDLKPSGLLTAATVEALNGRRPEKATDIIIANMERWRWMPHKLGSIYVMVNLPDYTLRVVHDGQVVWTTRIVIGKATMPTPIMTAEMKFITINPTWNVPPSIVHKEYLPALAQDPTVLERMGLRVGHNPDGTVHIWMPPGDRNALGRIRFNFPNKFLVYQHDTPDKYMFAYEKRAFSHGCMRVQDPAKYAEVLLSLVRPGDNYTQERIKRMFGPNETNIDFPTFVPVHITYQTAFVDDSGQLQFREDIYGRDKVLLALLKGDERKVADIPVEHRDNPARRAAMAIPDRGFGNGPFGGTGDNFFSRLFGGFNSQQPPARARRTAAHHRTVQR